VVDPANPRLAGLRLAAALSRFGFGVAGSPSSGREFAFTEPSSLWRSARGPAAATGVADRIFETRISDETPRCHPGRGTMACRQDPSASALKRVVEAPHWLWSRVALRSIARESRLLV